jgi:hypothetical protein
MNMNRQIWIGLAEVIPLEGCTALGGSKGAYVNVMAWAEDAAQFRGMLERNLGQLKLALADMRDPEPWEVRSTSSAELPEELFEMAQSIANDPAKVSFGVFHAWLNDEPGTWAANSDGQH